MNGHRFCCCSVRSWALFIGWYQTISCSIFCIAYLTLMILAGYVAHERSKEEGGDFSNIDAELKLEGVTDVNFNLTEAEILDEKMHRAELVASMGIAVMATVVGIIAGIYLIVGVKQANVRKLKFWMIFEIFFVALGVAAVIYGAIQGDIRGVVIEIVLILVSLLSLWIVNTHRQEILLNAVNAQLGAMVGFLKKV